MCVHEIMYLKSKRHNDAGRAIGFENPRFLLWAGVNKSSISDNRGWARKAS